MSFKTIMNKYSDYNTTNELNELCIKLIKKSTKYRGSDCESKFIINALMKDKRYSSYFRHITNEIEDYIEYGSYKFDDEEEIEFYIYDLCSRDIENIINIFKQKQLPPIELDSVMDEVGGIFEKVIGEKQGYIRDENGKFHKFGDNNEKYTELLGFKYPWFKESVCDNDERREEFINYLDELTHQYSIYEYNELDLIDLW